MLRWLDLWRDLGMQRAASKAKKKRRQIERPVTGT
jgi:hypothetical protein